MADHDDEDLFADLLVAFSTALSAHPISRLTPLPATRTTTLHLLLPPLSLPLPLHRTPLHNPMHQLLNNPSPPSQPWHSSPQIRNPSQMVPMAHPHTKTSSNNLITKMATKPKTSPRPRTCKASKAPNTTIKTMTTLQPSIMKMRTTSPLVLKKTGKSHLPIHRLHF